MHVHFAALSYVADSPQSANMSPGDVSRSQIPISPHLASPTHAAHSIRPLSVQPTQLYPASAPGITPQYAPSGQQPGGVRMYHYPHHMDPSTMPATASGQPVYRVHHSPGSSARFVSPTEMSPQGGAVVMMPTKMPPRYVYAPTTHGMSPYQAQVQGLKSPSARMFMRGIPLAITPSTAHAAAAPPAPPHYRSGLVMSPHGTPINVNTRGNILV